MRISLAMIVKDEELTLNSCLESVKDMVDEIVIVDTGSIDSTMEIAKSYGAKIYNFQWCDDFAKARNYAAEMCSGNWILVLDADEVIVSGSREDLEKFICENPKAIGRIEISSKFMDDDEVSLSKEYVSRFYPKGIHYQGCIHEQLSSNLHRVRTEIKVDHSGYFEKDKSVRNLKLLYKELENNPKDPYVLYQIARTLHVAKRFDEASEYFKRCFRYSSEIYTYTSSLVNLFIYNSIQTKDFEKGLKVIDEYGKLLENNVDFNFACGVFYMNLVIDNLDYFDKYFYLIEKSYLKCLSIGKNNDEGVKGLGTYKAAYNLGVFYETIGDLNAAREYYKLSTKFNYEKAKERLKYL